MGLVLPFGDEFMLQRVVRIVSGVVAPVVVVAAPDQDVPPLPEDVIIARDAERGRGPLQGLLVATVPRAGGFVRTRRRPRGLLPCEEK